MDPIQFIPITQPSQIRSLVPFARGIWIKHYAGIVDKGLVDYVLAKFQSFEAITGQIEQEKTRYFFMQGESGGPLGYIAVVPDTEKREMFLSKLYVKAGERRKGVGRQALGFAEGMARDMGLGKIFLTVNKNNSHSIAAYQKMGFRNMGPITKDIGAGFSMDDFIMSKELGEKGR